MKTRINRRIIVLFFVLASTEYALTAQSATEKSTITVLGQGSVTAEPDIAWVQIGVETFNREVAKATAENSTRMRDVYERLLSLGIEEKDMQTTNYNVYFERNYPDPVGQAGKGIEGTYHVVNTLTLTVRDRASLGKYIDQAIEAGANQLWGVQFGAADPEAFRKQARVKAIEDAKIKAEQLASAAQLKLGRLLEINETTGSPILPLGGRAAFMDSAASTPMTGGELTFTESLQMTWELR